MNIVLEAARDMMDKRIVAYHATVRDEPIRSFSRHTHFGTMRSAKHRLADKARKKATGLLYRVAIKGAFYRTTDQGANDQAHIHRELIDRFGEEYEAWYEENKLRTSPWDFLVQKGYAALVYRNEVEDKGSDSYVILDPGAVEILDVEKASTSGYRKRDLSNADKLKLIGA